MRLLPIAVLATVLSVPAHATTFTAGTNFGFMVTSSGGSSVFSLGWPSGGLLGGIEPGLRLGVIGKGGREEVFLNTGVSFLSLDGESIYLMANSLNYQHAFNATGVSPYVTIGIGAETFGSSGESQSNLMIGGALGIRQPVSGGHGAVRAEARYDHLNNSESSTSADSFGIQLGFDLWIK